MSVRLKANYMTSAMQNMVLLLLICTILAGLAAAQQDDEDAPPPIKKLSKEEKDLLAGETSIKGRTQVSLDLMSKRIGNAEALSSKHQYPEMATELGAFEALMSDALKYLLGQDRGNGKTLYGLKRLDIGLRGFTPRLETIRRDVPSEYDPYMKIVIKDLSETREKALEPMFGKGVITDL